MPHGIHYLAVVQRLQAAPVVRAARRMAELAALRAEIPFQALIALRGCRAGGQRKRQQPKSDESRVFHHIASRGDMRHHDRNVWRNTSMVIREILALKKNHEIFRIAPDRLVHDAVALMADHDIGSLVVMEGDAMVGLLTDHIIVRGLSKASCNLCNTLVRDIMLPDPISGHLDDTVDQVRRVMTDNHISHLPVVDDNGLAGIISFYDVAKTAISEAEFENKLLKGYIKNWPEA